MAEKQAQWIIICEVTQVLNSYFRALDEKNFEVSHLQLIFTPDAEVIRPNGAVTIGPEQIVSSHKESFARFRSTQHLLTGHEVNIDGEKATVRANLVAMHLWANGQPDINSAENYFLAGGVITARLLQSAQGWRISRIENRVVWRGGSFGSMLQTGNKIAGVG
jgi:hypothetical protein